MEVETMGLFKKGQGATEYLLMLAAVLVIVAVAIWYVMGAGGRPAVTMTATCTDNTIKLTVTSGTVPKADWQYRILKSDGTSYVNWTDGTVDIDPKNSPITLKENAATGNYTVQVYHKPSKSSWPDMSVSV